MLTLDSGLNNEEAQRRKKSSDASEYNWLLIEVMKYQIF